MKMASGHRPPLHQWGNRQLQEQVRRLQKELKHLTPPLGNGPLAGAVGEDIEGLYQRILERLLKEPAIIKLRSTRPEIEIEEVREVVKLDDKSLRGRIAKLIATGFFDQPRNGNTAFNELQRLGRGSAKPNVYRECDALAKMGFLTKEASGYQSVPDMKVNILQQ